MSFFKNLTKGFRKGAHEDQQLTKQLDTLNRDGRLHSRYIVHFDGIAALQLENGMTGVVKDISYGGMAVRFGAVGQVPDQTLPKSLIGTFILLDQRIDCRLSPVHVASQDARVAFVGFSMHHERQETLLFLRQFIEPLRCGTSLMPLEPAMRNERYQGREWSCFRGDGPTDLILKASPNGDRVDEALLTFRNMDNYCDLSVKAGALKTGRMLDKNASGIALGTRMATTATVDREILRQSVYILTGAPAACREVVRPLLAEVRRALELDSSSSGAA